MVIALIWGGNKRFLCLAKQDLLLDKNNQLHLKLVCLLLKLTYNIVKSDFWNRKCEIQSLLTKVLFFTY